MGRNAPFFYLRQDEEVLQRVRAEPSYALAILLPLAVAPTVLLGVALVLRAFLPGGERLPLWVPLAIWGALLVLAALAAWRRAATAEYALTDQRIYARVGRLVTAIHFTTHDRVTDIHYRQGPLDRLLGIGAITFSTAGGDVRVAGIRDPIALKEASERARDAFIRRLLQDAPAPVARVEVQGPEASTSPAVAARVAPATPPPEPMTWEGERPSYLQAGDVPVWFAKPAPVSALSSLRSLLGVFVLLVFLVVRGGPQAILIPAVLAVAVGAIGLRLWQLRRTEYVATDRRVYARRGLFGTTVNQLTYDKITDIAFTQDVLGRILGYGSVVLQTAGGNAAPIVMVGLRAPLDAKEAIERWRDASMGARA